MMTTLEEHVARAIYKSRGFVYEGRTISPEGPYGEWAQAIKDARTALAAVHEWEGSPMSVVANDAPDPAEAMRNLCEAIARGEEVRNPSNNGTQAARRIKRKIAALKGDPTPTSANGRIIHNS